MKVISGLDGLKAPLDKSVVTIGNFDGVHLAHQALLHRLRTFADRSAAPAVVLTFDPHPLSVVAPERVPPALTPHAEKVRLIADSGADILVVAHSEPSLLNLEAEDFLRDIVCQLLRPIHVVEGPTFGFGKGRKGTPQLLSKLAPQLGFELSIVEAVTIQLSDGRTETVSSSLIRRLLSAAQVADAARCLGRPYRLFGTVVAGDRRGRTLGFPTANLEVSNQMIPGDGVYGGVAQVGPCSFRCAISVGSSPTFSGQSRRVEAYMIGFEGDLYGQELIVDFTDWIRAQRAFPSAEALVSQLKQDAEAVRDSIA